jgi:hypothetical protein
MIALLQEADRYLQPYHRPMNSSRLMDLAEIKSFMKLLV